MFLPLASGALSLSLLLLVVVVVARLLLLLWLLLLLLLLLWLCSAQFSHLALTAMRHMVGWLDERDARECLVLLDRRFAAVSRHFLVVKLLRQVGAVGAPAHLKLGTESWLGVLRDAPDAGSTSAGPRRLSTAPDFYWRGRAAEDAQAHHEVS